jgi:ribonuclease HII
LLVAGIDEAGRGPLAGPVLAAAVILNPTQPIAELTDSKLLSPFQRDRLYERIVESALAFAVARADVWEIDHFNILKATLLAMQRAVAGLSMQPSRLLVDGLHVPDCAIEATPIVKGDRIIPAISAASILAKVERDRLMAQYHREYPEYSFHIHKGYGTKQHLLELERAGYSPLHRKSFNPIKQMAAQSDNSR